MRASICLMEQAPPAPSKAEIAHYLAVKAAEGVSVPQSWAKALDLLERSAQLGAHLAQAELGGCQAIGLWPMAFSQEKRCRNRGGRVCAALLIFRSGLNRRPCRFFQKGPGLRLLRTLPRQKCAIGSSQEHAHD